MKFWKRKNQLPFDTVILILAIWSKKSTFLHCRSWKVINLPSQAFSELGQLCDPVFRRPSFWLPLGRSHAWLLAAFPKNGSASRAPCASTQQSPYPRSLHGCPRFFSQKTKKTLNLSFLGFSGTHSQMYSQRTHNQLKLYLWRVYNSMRKCSWKR